MKRLIYALSLFALLPCCHAATQDKPIEVTVTHISSGTWRLNYQLPHPVSTVFFRRDVDTAAFALSGSGLAFAEISGAAAITSSAAFNSFEMTVKYSGTQPGLEKDYDPAFFYQDGGELLYTGRYYLRPANSAPPKTCFTVRTELQERVLFAYGGDRSCSSNTAGTYIYFGNTPVTEDANIIIVPDGSLPAWLTPTIRTTLPKLFAYYAGKTGYKLPFKPLLFISRNKGKSTGFSFGGGVLGNVIQINVTVPDKEDPDITTELLTLTAHEAAHFWNSCHDTARGAHWMHEGGAEYFSLLALYDLKLLDKVKFIDQLNSRFQKCQAGLGDFSLNNSHLSKLWRNYYTCGTVIGFFSDAELRRTPGQDIFSLWRYLLAEARKNGAYSQETYMRGLKTLSAGRSFTDNLTAFTDTAITDKTAFFNRWLAELAIPHSMYAETCQPELGVKAFSNLMTQDCGGSDFYQSNAKITLGEHLNCKTLQPRVNFNEINGINLFRNGYNAYTSAANSCRQTGKALLSFSTGANAVTVDCSGSEAWSAPPHAACPGTPRIDGLPWL